MPGGGAGTSLRPDEVTEEEGNHEDDQQDLGEQEEDDADPEADTDFLFEVHGGATLSRKLVGGPDLNLRSGDRRDRRRGSGPARKARERTRAEIAEVAFQVFAARGFDAVTATEVAAAAGISRASFFRYFDSKEDAVFVAQEEMGANVAAALRERPAGEDAWTALRRAGALDAASSRWAESDGADDLIELLDEAFGAIAEPFPALGA